MRKLHPHPLTAAAFSPFGRIIDLREAQQMHINYGLTTRFNDLAPIDTGTDGGRTIVSIFRSRPVPLPHTVTIMERHPLGSQTFIPTTKKPYLVLVAPPGATVHADDLQLYISNGQQGIHLYRNTWHHYQLVPGKQADFVVIDRAGPGQNLVETPLQGQAQVCAPDPAD